MLISQRAAHAEQASAGHGGEGLHFKPVLVEHQGAVQLAEAVGKVFEREGAVLKIDAALQPWISKGAVRLHLKCSGAAGGEIGIEGFGELEVDGAAGGQIQLARALEREGALRVQVGVFAGDVQRVKMDARVGQRSVYAALALEMDAGQGNGEFLEPRVALEAVRIFERAG